MNWSDLISGVVGGPIGLLLRIAAVLAAINQVSNMVRGPQLDRWLVDNLLRMRWRVVAAVFLITFLVSALSRGTTGPAAIALYSLLILAAVVLALPVVPAQLHLSAPAAIQPALQTIRTHPWRIVSAIFFLPTVILLLIDALNFANPPPPDQITFVVALADEELMEFREILDELEPELGAEVFLMNSKSGRYVGDLDRMVACSDDMKWDLIAVDNNKLGMLGAKELVEELSTYMEYDEIIPLTMLPSLRPLTLFEDKFYFAPFRPNVKIAFYNEKKFVQHGLRPPKTWDDLLHIAEVFEEREGGRVAIQGQVAPKAVSAVTAFEFIRAAGGDPMALDGDRTREAFVFLQELSEYLAPQFITTDWDTANEYLINDAVYLVDNWTFGIKVVVEDARKEEIKARSGWEGPAREFHVLGGDVLAVPKGAPHPELAVKLIELLLSQETQEQLVSRVRWAPMRLDAYGTMEPEMVPYFEAVRDALSDAEARPNVPQWTMVEDILADAFQALVVNGDDISTLDTYVERMEQVPSTYIRYQVKEEDTLESVAERYRTTVEMLAKVNDIPAWSSICKGQIVLVPPRKVTSRPSQDDSPPAAQ